MRMGIIRDFVKTAECKMRFSKANAEIVDFDFQKEI